MVPRLAATASLLLLNLLLCAGCGERQKESTSAQPKTSANTLEISDEAWLEEQIKQFPMLASTRNKQGLRKVVTESKISAGATLLYLSRDFILVAEGGRIEKKMRTSEKN